MGSSTIPSRLEPRRDRFNDQYSESCYNRILAGLGPQSSINLLSVDRIPPERSFPIIRGTELQGSTESARGHRRAALVQSLLGDVFSGRVRAGDHLVTARPGGPLRRQPHAHSRAPISLSGMGLIDLLPNRGAIVRACRGRKSRKSARSRRVLECEATRLACGRIALNELDEVAENYAE